MDTPLTILVVDDETGIRESLADYLEDMDCHVLMAENGEKALDIMRRQRVDLAIVDVRLPGIDGTQTIVQAQKIQPGLKYIVHTGSVTYQIPQELKSLGIGPDQILHKPVPSLDVILQTIQTVMGKSPNNN
ncbi:response regulator [Desulfoplanes sp.]